MMRIVAIVLALYLCLPLEVHAKKRRIPKPAINKNVVHLVWLVDTNTSWEISWVRELLSSVQGEIIEVRDFNKKMCLPNSICVTPLHEDKEADYERYFGKLQQSGFKFGIIHTGDEAYSHSTKSYANAQFVFRNYWHKKFASDPKVQAIPLGYKTNFWANRPDKKIPSVNLRRYNWSFAGQTYKSTRMSMIENMKQFGPFFVYHTDGFTSSSALPVDRYRDLLLDTIFAPCPRGNGNLDTFRICEALECGCIPIVERQPFDYFAHLFQCDDPYLSAYPFFSVDSWDEISEELNTALLSDLGQLEKLRKKCHSWWIDYKDHLKKQIAEKVSKAFFQ